MWTCACAQRHSSLYAAFMSRVVTPYVNEALCKVQQPCVTDTGPNRPTASVLVWPVREKR